MATDPRLSPQHRERLREELDRLVSRTAQALATHSAGSAPDGSRQQRRVELDATRILAAMVAEHARTLDDDLGPTSDAADQDPLSRRPDHGSEDEKVRPAPAIPERPSAPAARPGPPVDPTFVREYTHSGLPFEVRHGDLLFNSERPHEEPEKVIAHTELPGGVWDIVTMSEAFTFPATRTLYFIRPEQSGPSPGDARRSGRGSRYRRSAVGQADAPGAIGPITAGGFDGGGA
ncbi:hypothetical protein [Nocardiopsis sp. MG754419]|uniref:hypothetical protein n=1 Tax=Nocardiopsis sp. MG754419 TaxID=2259865 RepID=UPI001BAB7EB2|nr:hypothetical protein [Nocardiopsis sp. MG754419]MBR8742678.1 hypothetical protein [Nocardiopsis sp. MG754419]